MVKGSTQRQVDILQGHLATASLEPAEVAELPAVVRVPHVSVVVAAYNHRAFALELLESLSQQQAVPFEVVFVDDGSTDGSFAVIVQRATELGLAGRVIRLLRNRGRAVARNVGILHARADLIAFTDSDCLPRPDWLAAGLSFFADRRIGIVQGPTRPHPDQRKPFFNHFIEIERFDGTYSTCNVFYRRDALEAVGGFDATIVYWEDVDLGWRVRRAGWQAAFAPGAEVYHQVIPLSPMKWLQWPRLFSYMPAKVARYPEYRRYLFLGLWVHWFHALFNLAVLALPLGVLVRRELLALALPYLVAFPFRHGLRGRWPPVKAAFHLAWDVLSFFVLLLSSLRHRTPVL